MTNSEMNQIVKIAADSLDVLRRSDVYRLLSAVANKEAAQFARFIVNGRPDLESEAYECLQDILAA